MRAPIGGAGAGLALGILLCITPARSTAQTAPSPHPLTLQDAIAIALARNPTLQIGRRQVDVGRGAVLAAQGEFDPQVETSISRDRSEDPQLGATGVTSALTNSLTYKLGLTKEFRSGLTVTPEVGLSQVATVTPAGPSTNSASVGLTLLVPLLENWRGAVVSATEDAASREYDATISDLHQTAASSVLNAAVAYWGYLAADRRLDVFRSSESRAQQLVDETERLVAADERPAGDMKQLRANLAAKRAARIAAEQSLIEARQQVGLALGLDPDAIATLSLPATPFPTLPDSEVASSDTTSIALRIAAAVQSRADVAAAREREDEARVLRDAARNSLKPGLDLAISVGYQGLELGRGVDQLFSPLYRNVSGLNLSVQLRYDYPLNNRRALGQELQNASAYAQQRITREDLVRRISTDVLVTTQALQHSKAGLLASRQAVTLSEQSVENEKQKFRLGMSTLFDVILAEDGLTNARLSEITSEQSYAAAIARLRFATGTLVHVDGLHVDVRGDELVREP
ncbi:MAG TPA: TolC family protein [Gemmatimonadaceae bacterium]|nr:TolC family protein [Gemmatimonadaceae bacterium]